MSQYSYCLFQGEFHGGDVELLQLLGMFHKQANLMWIWGDGLSLHSATFWVRITHINYPSFLFLIATGNCRLRYYNESIGICFRFVWLSKIQRIKFWQKKNFFFWMYVEWFCKQLPIGWLHPNNAPSTQQFMSSFFFSWYKSKAPIRNQYKLHSFLFRFFNLYTFNIYIHSLTIELVEKNHNKYVRSTNSYCNLRSNKDRGYEASPSKDKDGSPLWSTRHFKELDKVC